MLTQDLIQRTEAKRHHQLMLTNRSEASMLAFVHYERFETL